ncbi:hypothetical protein LEP1GSC137_2598 [Leptospira borgpetersenii str. Noumea 25]|uniref:Uncharacterized protein n=1 Tax=Leptospira borgpetersenii serovar Ballum TaxID=280505 RepID=A0A0S2IUY0_LEPBO|nr:hypothetical protein LBBP_03255 [Leptospira borgpetersenii serovar Ballum]EKQ99792.1 hypothetical protein LEP1GSC121_2048 [Leptospira borgpetersenii serovar Castellonis str. 200801910]EMO09008.1 hypothetical protein LEP1GSC137_2598 [Leptospira borgpetersenii str. Noumea 25]
MDFLADFIVGTFSYEFLHSRFWDKFSITLLYINVSESESFYFGER